jgi:hypothetical protein
VAPACEDPASRAVGFRHITSVTYHTAGEIEVRRLTQTPSRNRRSGSRSRRVLAGGARKGPDREVRRAPKCEALRCKNLRIPRLPRACVRDLLEGRQIGGSPTHRVWEPEDRGAVGPWRRITVLTTAFSRIL